MLKGEWIQEQKQIIKDTEEMQAQCYVNENKAGKKSEKM